MEWQMPEVEDRRRSEVDPCVITLSEGESAEDVAISIVEAAINGAVSPGLAAIPAAFHDSSGDDIFSPEDAEGIRAELQQQGRISLDYWKGRMVKLTLVAVDQNTLHISLNVWTDRLPLKFAPMNIPTEAVDDLTKVLEAASSAKV